MSVKPIELSDWHCSDMQRVLVNEVLDSGRLTYGPMTQQFEERWASLHDREYAIFTSSGTSALKIALGALKELHQWDSKTEVLVPAVTFIASVSAVLMNDLLPVLVDVDPDLSMNILDMERKAGPNTKAIMPVHLLGQSSDMSNFIGFAQRHDLVIVEDSCESCFVKDEHGFPIGSRGDIACFSTYFTHQLSTGVGGFITTNDATHVPLIRSLMFHGRDPNYLSIDDNIKEGVYRDRFKFPRFGHSDRLTELEAALGVAALRQRNALRLEQGLESFGTFPWRNGVPHGYMMFPICVKDRDRLVGHLERSNIHTRTLMPLTNQKAVQDYFGIGSDLEDLFPCAKRINEEGLLLPCHPGLSSSDIDKIISTIKDFCA
jgi:perosamine synthetase